MKTSRKMLTISMLAILTSISLTGCNKKENASKKIVFWHTMGTNNETIVKKMATEFLKLPENKDYTIELLQQGGYTDINDKLLKGLSAGNLPTMAFCYPDHVADYLDANAVVELSSYVEASDAATAANPDDPYQFNSNDYIDAFWNEGKEYTKEGLYSVPFSKSTEVMFYNKTFFKANQIAVPTTWDEVIEVSKKIVAMDDIKNNAKYVAPVGYDSDDNLFISFCEQKGLPYTSVNKATGKGSIDFNTEDVRKMIEEVKGWYDNGYLTTKGLIGNNTYTSTKFTEQTLHMTIGSTGGTTYNFPKNKSFEVGVAPLPQWNPDDPKSISQGPSIVFFNKGQYASQKQIEVAWRFYTYMTGAVNSAKYAISTGYEPVRKSSYATEEYEKHLAIYDATKGVTTEVELKSAVANLTMNLQDYYFTSPVFVGSAVARNQVGAILPAVCAGDKSIVEAFEEAYSKCTVVL